MNYLKYIAGCESVIKNNLIIAPKWSAQPQYELFGFFLTNLSNRQMFNDCWHAFGWFIAEKTLNYPVISTSFFKNKSSPNIKMRQKGRIFDLKTSGQIELL